MTDTWFMQYAKMMMILSIQLCPVLGGFMDQLSSHFLILYGHLFYALPSVSFDSASHHVFLGASFPFTTDYSKHDCPLQWVWAHDMAEIISEWSVIHQDIKDYCCSFLESLLWFFILKVLAFSWSLQHTGWIKVVKECNLVVFLSLSSTN